MSALSHQEAEAEVMARFRRRVQDPATRRRYASEAEMRQSELQSVVEGYIAEMDPKARERLGVFYTPLEVVDFINNSVADILRDEFGTDFNDPRVKVLDPASGCGAFLVRLIQSGLISEADLPRKYRRELFSNEVMPLSFAIGKAAVSDAYRERTGDQDAPDFPGARLRDTFAGEGFET